MNRRVVRSYCIVLAALFAHGAFADSFIKVLEGPPPGFEALSAVQSTQADVYFGGQYIGAFFVDFDVNGVNIDEPLAIAEAIPNIKDPEKVASVLSGRLSTNADLVCSARNRQECGVLYPQVADVIFDESRFRLDVFVNERELLLHAISRQKYLPAPTAPQSLFSDIRMNLAGDGGERRFNIGSESYLAHEASRIYGRYAYSERGFSLYELAWQHDAKDVEYELGSFRSRGANATFVRDVDVVGLRMASSTKVRADLDDLLTTPIHVFLSERSRVDVYRGDELINSRFYDAGNQQIDTETFPDGAYQVTLRVTGQSGRESAEEHFFVRTLQMPPVGEPQYYVEAGSVVDTHNHAVPRAVDAAWFRLGSNHRVRDNLALDTEFAYAGGESLVQTGALLFQSRVQGYLGLMYSGGGDIGYAIRGGWRGSEYSANLDLRRIYARDSADPYPRSHFESAEPLRLESLTQLNATLAMPLAGGRLFLRGRVNKRAGADEQGLGFSYYRGLHRRNGLAVDFNFDGFYADEQSWIRFGVSVQWQRSRDTWRFTPEIEASHAAAEGADFGTYGRGYWHADTFVPGLGAVDRALYFNRDSERSALGARFIPENQPLNDFELGIHKRSRNAELFYALNNQFSVVTQRGETAVSSGGGMRSTQAAAIVIRISGNTFEKFEVVVNDRVVGHAWPFRENVISLRPYETYAVRVRPAGNKIVGFDESIHQVTLYPGNVQTLEFSASDITVLIGRAVFADGTPVRNARFENVEGYGASDGDGWFQVEVATSEPLRLRDSAGALCALRLPKLYAADGLAMLGDIVCGPILE